MATQTTDELDALMTGIENTMTYLNARLQNVNTFRLNLASAIDELRGLLDPILALTTEEEVKDALNAALSDLTNQISETDATAEAFNSIHLSVSSVMNQYNELTRLLEQHINRIISRY